MPDPTDEIRKHFEPDGSPHRVALTFFCAWCKSGPMFTWEKRTYAGEVICRDCNATATAVDNANC